VLRSLLVPLDGSAFAEHALPTAVSIARRAGARVELVRVHEPGEGRERAQAYLHDLAARVTAAAPVEVGRSLLEGRPADVLCEWLPPSGTDLVVMTTHGRGPLSRLWSGSVAAELMQRLPVPVLLVRPGECPPDLTADAAPRRVLVALDGSPFGESVVPLAAAVGTLTGAEFRLLRVVPPVLTSDGEGAGPLSPRTRTVAEALEADGRSYLHEVAMKTPALRRAWPHVVVDWPPAEAILADAAAHRADLIALATHGRGELSQLLLGSVAEQVVRGASVPVLLARPATEP